MFSAIFNNGYSIPYAFQVKAGQATVTAAANKTYRQPNYNPYRDGTPGLGEVSSLNCKLNRQVHYAENPSEKDIQCLRTFVNSMTHYHNAWEIGDQLGVRPEDPDIKIGQKEFECQGISKELVQAFLNSGYLVERNGDKTKIGLLSDFPKK